jgi:G:T/U-mismatch repair DNA glycosylase
MISFTLNRFSNELHPWKKEIPPEAAKLLIGTFPSIGLNGYHEFFYSSPTNRFWKVIVPDLLGKPIENLDGKDLVGKKKMALELLGLGLTDMGARVYRQQGSSNDHSLFPIEFMDIIQILNEHPSINSLIVSGEKSGNSSMSWFGIFCSLNNIKLNLKELTRDKFTSISTAGRSLKVFKAYSPSRMARGVSDEKLIQCYSTIILEGKPFVNQND